MSFVNYLRRTARKSGKAKSTTWSKRSRGDHDSEGVCAGPEYLALHGRMSQQTKATQIRALGVSEADILNFLSDNLYARMRTPGGPRDSNEVPNTGGPASP